MHYLLAGLPRVVVGVPHHRVKSLLLTRVFLPGEVVPRLVLRVNTEVRVVDILKTGLVGGALIDTVWPIVCVELASLIECHRTVCWLWTTNVSTG